MNSNSFHKWKQKTGSFYVLNATKTKDDRGGTNIYQHVNSFGKFLIEIVSQGSESMYHESTEDVKKMQRRTDTELELKAMQSTG